MNFDSFTVVLLERRDDAPQLSEAEAGALQDAHLAYLAELHDAGHLVAAGPIGDPDSAIRGVSIMNVDAAEALRLKSADPAVRAGVYRLVVLPWMTPAGALHFTHTRMPRSRADVRAD
jgi:uncharacterized protein YciI